MKRYDSYKDSGIEWIGEIPSHWTLKKLKFFGKITLGKMLTPDDKGGYVLKPYLRAKNIEWYSPKIEEVKEMWFSEKELNQYKLYKNDLLVSEGGEVGRTCIWNDELEECYIQNSVQRVAFNNFESAKYFLNQFVLFGKRGHFDAIVNRISIAHLTKEKLGDVDFVYPPIDEQTAIANYLDKKTTQIDNLITKKVRLIQLLEEEQTAIINQAVTKGLDPSVPMKDSGIEWLGEIPAHWQVKRMRYLCDITTGGRDTENREDDGLYPFYVRSQTVERISSYSFDGEAILTAGDGVGVCKVWHYVNEKFDFHQRVYMMCNFQQVLGEYLFFYLKENFGKEVMKLSAKSTVDSLRRPMFQNFLVCFGDIDEQKKIILKIQDEENRIQTIISKTQQDIQLLKEYKTVLISEVVTGKVDVRKEK